MKVQRHLFAIAIMVTSSVSALAGVSSEQKREHLRKLRTAELRQANVTPLERAYLDALNLLGQPGECRAFFGRGAERPLEDLVIELHEERMDNASIGIRMSGPFTLFGQADENLSYRLFARAALNSQGPFFRAKNFPAEPLVPNVGPFGPNTRAARVLMLMHELAHLIQGKNQEWLIPDDGGNPQLSRQNTSTIESRCRAQIRNL